MRQQLKTSTHDVAKVSIRQNLPALQMSEIERRYESEILGRLLKSGKVVFWRFKMELFQLGIGEFYTPSFGVVMSDGSKEFHQIKCGVYSEDSINKLNTAALFFSEYHWKMMHWKDYKWATIRNY